MLRLTYLMMALLFAGVLAFTGCNKDDDDHNDHNHIEITILSPGDNETVSDPSNVKIHIKFEADDELHDIEIKLHPENDASDLIIDFDIHTHQKTYEFETMVDLSGYPAGTEFELDIDACEDEACTKKESKHIHFKI